MSVLPIYSPFPLASRWAHVRNEFHLEAEISKLINYKYVGTKADFNTEYSIRSELFYILKEYCLSLNVPIEMADITVESYLIPEPFLGSPMRTTTPDIGVRLDRKLIQRLQDTPEWREYRLTFAEKAKESAIKILEGHAHKIKSANKYYKYIWFKCTGCNKSIYIRTHENAWHEYVLNINNESSFIINIHNVDYAFDERIERYVCDKYISML